MKLLRIALLPIVPFYYLVTFVRNVFFDLKIFKSKSHDFPVICVGNLSVGGTGKTPLVEFLIKSFKNRYKISVLSRGYGRKTKGFILANASVNSDDIGDEPFQIFSKFKDDITLSVCEDRNLGVENLKLLNKIPEVLILDDAFQHRKIKPSFSIILSSFADLFTNDILLPTGNLRESKSGIKRANVIVVSKVPLDTKQEDKNRVKENLSRYGKPVFFSSIEYSDFLIFNNHTKLSFSDLGNYEDVKVVTGIAKSEPFIDFLNNKGVAFSHLNFKDHHNFSLEETNQFKDSDLIITTEKDFTRLKGKISETKLCYIPIHTLIEDCDRFIKLIDNSISSF
jgi:tetraacyldisaccharide 4'-kinase